MHFVGTCIDIAYMKQVFENIFIHTGTLLNKTEKMGLLTSCFVYDKYIFSKNVF